MELVRQACAQAVQERDDLDWKSTLPLTLPAGKEPGRDAQQDELAKDIAAMANSRGGLIIYGVAETRGANAASHIESVGEPDETTLQNIRRVASNLIYPPVTTLALRWLTSQESEDVALALEVAPSIEAPHLVRPRRQPSGSGFWFAVPFRNGPDTDWMPEKMIESAYRDRLANRRLREEDLHQLHTDLVAKSANMTGGSWIVAVARPENPLPPRPRLDLEKAAAIFQRAWQTGWSVQLHQAVSAAWVLRATRVHRGLRRFSQIGSQVARGQGGNPTIRVTAEVHFDGSVGVAFTRGGAFGPNEFPDERFLAITDLDQAALDLFALAQQTARELHVPGDYEARLTVEPATGTLFRRSDPVMGGMFQQFTEDDRIGIFQPITGPLLFSQGPDAALDSLVDFAEDAVSQIRTGSQLDILRLQP